MKYLLDSFVVLHAAFISSLHRLIGAEFGANKSPPPSEICILSLALHRLSGVRHTERHLRDYQGDVPDVTAQSEEQGKEPVPKFKFTISGLAVKQSSRLQPT
jgi:hypothetical protein